MIQQRLTRFCVLMVAWALATSAAAQAYKAEAFSAAPPGELAAAVRETLANDAIRVTGPQGALCEIWLRAAVPAKAAPAQGLGIAYGQLAEGTLVGAIRFLVEVKDYRRQIIKPGIYTLRYATHPVDGNHLGVSQFRDFLLLAPVAMDSNAAAPATNDLLNLSRKASGTTHPSVWSLVESEGEAAAPAIVHREEEDHWVLRFRVQVQAPGGAAAPLVMSLVVVGYAPEA